jgi:N-acetyl-alpha-D-muramate 1-phosphate uridylyltransferase
VAAEVVAVVLAAGEGRRLRPLTDAVPKALCPVGNVPLLDLALRRLAALGITGRARVAVNASYLGAQVVDAVAGRAHLSVEEQPLGTSGALGRLRDWIDGRGVLVSNVDAYLAGGQIAPLLEGWDGESTRLLGVPLRGEEPGGFSGRRFAGYSLLPWHRVKDLTDEPGNLARTVWRPAEAAGELTVVDYEGTYLDTGTPPDYLAANLHTTRGGILLHPDAEVTGQVSEAVVGAGAVVRGRVHRAVIWAGARVEADEEVVDAIRYPGGTVPAGS